MNAYLSEELVGQSPVVLRRRVKWGECDPAGVVYTPVFSEYAIAAFQAFMGVLLGTPLQHALETMDVNTPLRALSFDFRRSLYPDQVFDMTVRVREIGTTTFNLEILFSDDAGRECTLANFTVVCIHYALRKSRTVPPVLRERLEQYRAACDDSAPATSPTS